jgi:hypothetical protein
VQGVEAEINGASVNAVNMDVLAESDATLVTATLGTSATIAGVRCGR